MDNIELLISESIKTGKWLDISYQNSQNETTYYWIAIKDIDLKKILLIVEMFNDQKSIDCLEATIRFDRILSAKLLDFTTYDVPEELIQKIEHNKEDAEWLKFESFNNNILRYYLKCNELDNDPFQKDSCLIEGIDKRETIPEPKATTHVSVSSSPLETDYELESDDCFKLYSCPANKRVKVEEEQ